MPEKNTFCDTQGRRNHDTCAMSLLQKTLCNVDNPGRYQFLSQIRSISSGLPSPKKIMAATVMAYWIPWQLKERLLRPTKWRTACVKSTPRYTRRRWMQGRRDRCLILRINLVGVKPSWSAIPRSGEATLRQLMQGQMRRSTTKRLKLIDWWLGEQYLCVETNA